MSQRKKRLGPSRFGGRFSGLGRPVRAAAFLAAALLVAVSSFAAEEPKPFYLPKSPVAAAYMLGRLSNKELVEAPRSEFVFVALLERNGLERKYRLEALEGLAGLRKTSILGELLRGVSNLDRKGDDGAPTVRELATILLQSKSADLAPHRAELEKMASDAKTLLARQVGLAALVTADGSIDPAWRAAEPSSANLSELLVSLSLVRDAALRASAYPKVEPLLHQTVAPELHRAAIMAVASLPGHELETFNTLAGLAQSEGDRATAVASLQSLPRDLWPKAQAEPLVKSLIAYLQAVPVDQRTAPDAANAFQFATDLATLLPAERAAAVGKSLRALGVSVVVVRTLKEQMLYDRTLIVVEAGKPMEIVLINDDAMPHNLVVVVPGALQEIGEAAEKMPPVPDPEGRLYIPASPKILHATRLVESGQRARLSFTAPEEPGDYQYVCTFPGHWRRMVGTLAVVKDVEAYLAAHPNLGPPKTTLWKLEDLRPDLAKLAGDRNLGAGKQLFTQLACKQCHKIGVEGNTFGPDLTEVFKRWKDDPASVLEQILEPSKVIEERFRAVRFELKDGDDATGIIIKEEPDTFVIQAGPSESLIQTLKKSDIQKREPQRSSLMPVGLLNALAKDQILDLLAFLKSGGTIPAHEHPH